MNYLAGTPAESYLSHNDLWSQWPLGPIIGRRSMGMIQEGEQLLIEFYDPLAATTFINLI
jgi:hypothetical protein